jgi:hypothetical protein
MANTIGNAVSLRKFIYHRRSAIAKNAKNFCKFLTASVRNYKVYKILFFFYSSVYICAFHNLKEKIGNFFPSEE